MKVIVDQDDPTYYERRAAEFIAEGQGCEKAASMLHIGAEKATYMARYHECMKQAITLLALARLSRNGPVQTEGDEKRRA